MITFKQYRMLFETPNLNDANSEDILSLLASLEGPEKETKIQDDFYKAKLSGNLHAYYRKENGQPKEISIFSKNSYGGVTHFITHKQNGQTSNVVKNIENASEDFGDVYSDRNNTKGAKNFWLNSHKNFKNHKVFLVDDGNKTEKEITSDELKQREPEIWTKDGENKFRLKISKK